MELMLVGFISYSIEYCTLAYIANNLLVKRFSSTLNYSMLIGLAMIRRLLFVGEMMYPDLVISLLFLVLVLGIFYRRDLKKKASLLIIFCAITVCLEIVAGTMVSLAFGIGFSVDRPLAIYTAYTLHKLFLCTVSFLLLKIHKGELYLKDWLKYFPVPIGIFFLFVLLFNPYLEDIGGGEKSISLGILGFLTCIFMVGYVQYKEKQGRTAEMLRMSEEHKWSERHFREDRAAILRNRDRMAHDTQHHLESVIAMNTIEDVRAYLEPLLKVGSYKMEITGNDDIDCILWPKQQRAEEMGISFKVTGVLPDDMDFLHKYDIVTIIGNALANAIDACEKITGKGAFINVSFHLSRHLTIQIDNSFVKAPVLKKSGWFRSTKKEPGHGFGMESIREVVERYNGHMETVIENGIFSLRILLQQIKPLEMAFVGPPGQEVLRRNLADLVSESGGSVSYTEKDGVASTHIRIDLPENSEEDDDSK